MEIVISRKKIYGEEQEVITIKDSIITYQTNNDYPHVLSENAVLIEQLATRVFSLTYTWKQEYIGPRSVDGYKYIISLDINHKRKTYKIQNKYPDNWEDFDEFRDSIINGGYLK